MLSVSFELYPLLAFTIPIYILCIVHYMLYLTIYCYSFKSLYSLFTRYLSLREMEFHSWHARARIIAPLVSSSPIGADDIIDRHSLWLSVTVLCPPMTCRMQCIDAISLSLFTCSLYLSLLFLPSFDLLLYGILSHVENSYFWDILYLLVCFYYFCN